MFNLFRKKPNTHARGIANAAFKMATAAVSRDDLAATKRHIRPSGFAWTVVFAAINTYAILSNVRTSIADTDRKAILLDLVDEFHAHGFVEVYGESEKLTKLLISMKNSGGPLDFKALGLWALEKTGYGCAEYPRQQGDETMLQVTGEELFAYLGSIASVIVAADDAGELNWRQ
jgi:hypothetical protein